MNRHFCKEIVINQLYFTTPNNLRYYPKVIYIYGMLSTMKEKNLPSFLMTFWFLYYYFRLLQYWIKVIVHLVLAWCVFWAYPIEPTPPFPNNLPCQQLSEEKFFMISDKNWPKHVHFSVAPPKYFEPFSGPNILLLLYTRI